MIAERPEQVLAFAAAEPEGSVAVVTLVGIDGSFSRRLGTQMAVAADGRRCGSLSGGCAEQAVIAEARRAIAERAGRTIRFGRGSPFIDVRFPCGGGVDLLVTPGPERAILAEAYARVQRRGKATLLWSAAGVAAAPQAVPRCDADRFLCRYLPAMRMVAIGEGAALAAFARLCRAYGAVFTGFAPDPSEAAALSGEGLDIRPLTRAADLDAVAIDRWTAVVLLFHNHDWEEKLLPGLLGRDGFYFGAMGSPRSQTNRAQALAALGVSEADLARLRGPIGLIPSAREPDVLALSVLAEVAGAYQKLVVDAERLEWGAG